jgi:hypothetical protein
MMRRWSLLRFHSLRALAAGSFVLATGACPCEARVVINELYYDHPGKDDTWEFVELLNTGTEAVDLAGWSIEFIDGSTLKHTVLWRAGPGIRIAPGELLSVAGSAWNPDAALRLEGAIGNGPDAVRLASPTLTADLVGYGQCVSPDLFEGGPAEDVPAGSSLSRKPDGADTDRNDADFVRSVPTPGRRNFFERDAALRFGAGGILPCGGAVFSFGVVLENRGTAPFAATVEIAAEAIDRGIVASTGGCPLAVSLASGAADSTTLAVRAPPAGRFILRAYLAEGSDDNASNDTAFVAVESSPGPVVVNEIMYRPREGMSEWIEIANRSSASANLAGWSMCDATGSRRLIASSDCGIEPGGFAVIAKDSAALMKEFPRCAAPVKSPEGGWPALNDTDRGDIADLVELRDAEGVLVERVTYHDLLDGERGRSIERISTEACGGIEGGLWHRCAARSGGTPGAANSTRLGGAAGGRGLNISPNPFSPARDGMTAITGSCAEGETGFLVRVFDLGGLEVRRVYGERGGARDFTCRWDGRANDGSRVETGLYVCCVEFTGRGGGVCRREKRLIAVAGN